jgi:NADH-quinone oxidoreductase subunit H
MLKEVIKQLWFFLVVPGFLFTAAIGLFSTWIDRKITARLQYRQGPPWYQPFADILKLLGKQIFVPAGGSKLVFLAAPLFGLTAAILVSATIWLINIDRSSGFIGDLIVLIYLLLIPSIALIIGGSASRSPIAALGSSREIKLILAYELPFLLAIFTVVAKSGSLLLGNIINYQSAHGMMLASASGLIAFLVALLVIQAKLGYVPFDIPEAEQEIMGGPLIEYSGAPLAVFKITKAMLFFILPVFLITLFLGGIDLSTFAGVMWLIIKYVILLLLVILIKNTNPRLRIDQAVRFFWGPVTALASIGFILAMIGW